MTTAKSVNVLDLPISKVEIIERSVGAKMTEWPEGVESIADLYAQIWAIGTDTDIAEVKAMSLRELTALVQLDEGEPDPT